MYLRSLNRAVHKLHVSPLTNLTRGASTLFPGKSRHSLSVSAAARRGIDKLRGPPANTPPSTPPEVTEEEEVASVTVDSSPSYSLANLTHEAFHMTPGEIVKELDKYVIGQEEAKKSVAIAMRARWRRFQLSGDMQKEVHPANLLMMGPTGSGKTEIARRVAKLSGSPFTKVEATRYTEVGVVGSNTDSMVKDLVESAFKMEKERALESVMAQGRKEACIAITSILKGWSEVQWNAATDGKYKEWLEEDAAKGLNEEVVEIDEVLNTKSKKKSSPNKPRAKDADDEHIIDFTRVSTSSGRGSSNGKGDKAKSSIKNIHLPPEVTAKIADTVGKTVKNALHGKAPEKSKISIDIINANDIQGMEGFRQRLEEILNNDVNDLDDDDTTTSDSDSGTNVRSYVPMSDVEAELQNLNDKNNQNLPTFSCIHRWVSEGRLDQCIVTVDLPVTEQPEPQMPPISLDGEDGMIAAFPLFGTTNKRKRTSREKTTIEKAIKALAEHESEKLIDMNSVKVNAVRSAEETGIIFIDEIDKLCRSSEFRVDGHSSNKGEGVQKELLSLIEGTVVNTPKGPVRTDHILFITSGAFYKSKPNDLLPELQGRLPIRVALKPLTEEEFRRVLTEPQYSIVKQQQALMRSENILLDFTSDGIQELARVSAVLNHSVENLGARRLTSVVSQTLYKLGFSAPDIVREAKNLVETDPASSTVTYEGKTYDIVQEQGTVFVRVAITKESVEEATKDLMKKTDLSKFTL